MLICLLYCGAFVALLWRIGTARIRDVLQQAMARVPVLRALF
jgi:hypothetical protein